MSDVAIGPLTKFAWNRVRRLTEGNGAVATDVSLIKSHEGLYEFEAVAVLSPLVEQVQKQIKGKPAERVHFALDNRAEMDGLAQSLRQDRERIGECLTIAAQKVRDEPSYGWGFNKDRLALPELNATLSYSEQCQPCHGEAHLDCPTCHGHKTVVCPSCHGSINQRCQQCAGSGKTLGPSGDTQICNQCQGRTTVPCRVCSERGRMPCTRCHARGKIECSHCDGSGVLSTILTLQFAACARFQSGERAHDNLLPALSSIIKKMGAQKLSDNLAKIEIINETSNDTSRTIHYLANFPYAECQFTAKAHPVQFHAIGHTPICAGITPFLDRLIEPALTELDAVRTGHNPFEHFKNALDYKIIAMALKKKNTPQKIRMAFNNAVSIATADSIKIKLHDAIDNLSETPKLLAGAFVAAGSLLYFALHFFVKRQNPWPFHPPDLTPLLIMLVVQFISIRIVSEILFKYILQRKNLSLPKTRIALPFGKIDTYLLMAIAVLYGAVTLISLMRGSFTI